ncbi:MAG TPA: HAMP domain-containing sensor histidine kinase [bacterium]|nr:HAMP domain-containing sensor histidine kinase [bacterium]HPR87899.1 HAMP domain-containing sensor histidine kinase [bacterium]
MNENVQKISVDRQLRIESCFGDLLQRHLGETLKAGQLLQRRLQAIGWPEAAVALQAAVKQGQTSSGEQEYAAPQLALQWQVEPWVEGERVRGALLAIREITWEKRRQRQFELSRQMTHMGQLAHQVVSRLHQPLASILHQIGCLLLEEPTGTDWPRIRQELGTIQEQIYALSQLTQALDAFSPDENGNGKLVQLTAILEKSVEVSQLLTAQRGVGLRLQARPEPVIIYANEIMLEQCLLQLLRNAIEFSPEGGEVSVRCEQSEGMAVVAIQDAGPGMSPAELAHAFDPFYTTRTPDHLGLGLPISYSIAAQYKGVLELESTPGSGTTARLLFPIAKSLVKKG